MKTDAFKIERGRRGPRVSPTGEWDDSIALYMKKNGIRELFLNSARGWRGRTMDFLEDLTELEGLWIIDSTVDDISPIHCLKNLKALSVTTLSRTHIDFSCFPQLELCVLDWEPGYASVFDCVWLRGLFVDNFKGKDSSAFSTLKNLSSLSILNGPLPDIRGLAELTDLKHLALCNLRKLSSLDGLENLTNLTHLEVHGCRRIGNINAIGNLRGIIMLQLDETGDIESLAPLRGLDQLRHLFFIGGTNVLDGDLSVIENLPALGGLSFMNRKHYSHRREEFWQFTNRIFCPFNPHAC